MAILPPGAELSGGRFEVIEHLGSGSEADVYAVTDRAAGEMRCVKRSAVSSADPACATRRERFRRVGTLRTGCHGVLDPLELIDGEDLLIVFPLIDGCDLDAFVSREGGHLHKRAAAAIDLQILSAVLQLGQAGFIHRDLKPLNVLVGRDHCVRIIDLGAAARAGECLSASFIGTTPWCAPEQHRDPEGVTTAADLFASGLIGAWLYTSQHPYPFEEPDAFLRAADRGVERPVGERSPRRLPRHPRLPAAVARHGRPPPALERALEPHDRSSPLRGVRPALPSLQRPAAQGRPGPGGFHPVDPGLGI